jgi:hypothetical protein
MDSRPKQHKHYIKRKLMTAIAIIIIIIDTASAAANNVVTVNRIKTATTTEPQNTGQQAYATHVKPGTRTKKQDKRGNEVNAKHDTGKEQSVVFLPYLVQQSNNDSPSCASFYFLSLFGLSFTNLFFLILLVLYLVAD